MPAWKPVLLSLGLVAACFAVPGVLAARPSAGFDQVIDSQGADPVGDPYGYLQCVPYARKVSGIQLYGDALTWWDQAQGHYARGSRPKVGAVMSFRPYGRMELGHVAAVSRVIDSRTVLLRHANWSPIDGRRGQIEDNVRAIDVSPDNDWSAVRVWYAPLGDLGTTHWPVNGFIYNTPIERLAGSTTLVARAAAPTRTPTVSRIGPDFLAGIAPEVKQRQPQAPARIAPARMELARYEQTARRMNAAPARANDPIGRIIASRMR